MKKCNNSKMGNQIYFKIAWYVDLAGLAKKREILIFSRMAGNKIDS
jgi:hypothetical protein